ncbi:MAG: PcfB family protein [Lachnospiraceae bacterium]|nr:PcfB family protein [Lachnospiraceae bacterium]
MTARTFFRLLDKYLRHEEMKSRNKQIDKRYNESQHRNDPKKVKVKDLVKDGSGVSTIEIKDEKIRQFEKLARHNGVRYAIKKDKSTMPPTYIVFFRAKYSKKIDELDSYLTLDINDSELNSIYKKIKATEQRIIEEKVNVRIIARHIPLQDPESVRYIGFSIVESKMDLRH